MTEAEKKALLQKKVQHKRAEEELAALEANDMTAAFAALQEAEELERKAEAMGGSGETEETKKKKVAEEEAKKK